MDGNPSSETDGNPSVSDRLEAEVREVLTIRASPFIARLAISCA